MTEYETASLHLQTIATWSGLAVGVAQCALISAGLWMMHRASRSRDRAMDAVEKESERRHAEAMAAHAENMAAHAHSLEALRALIRDNRSAGQAGD